MLLALEIFEPSVNEGHGDRCEREGINTDVELVAGGAVLAVVGVAMQQREPVVDRPMRDVAIIALGVT